ncbi:MAG: hypothetical protein D6710_04485 [Nitrospirae bacterium]|nr:MAG: hypothetical protein D6710_04485 [Nitrospirota bacterium]
MKQSMANRGLYIGTGAGLILFALVGLLPGSLIGGIVGLKIAGLIFGSPVQSMLIARVLVALSMVAGVLGAAFVFVVGTGVAGWLVGTVIDTLRAREATTAEALESSKK